MAMATIDESSLPGKIRDRPIAEELRRVLERAADAAGIDVVRVTSGGQPGSRGRSTGSTRHNGGRAADLQLMKGGRILEFSDQDGGPDVELFVTSAAANGATGIGAGEEYMGPRTIHVGFGTTPADHSKLVWGKGGRSINAPAWLREAANRGWDNPTTDTGSDAPTTPSLGRFVVIARGGLHVRKGPGLEFGITVTLVAGAEVDVLGFDGADGEWARVDLRGDGRADGHMFATFLKPVGVDEDGDETAAEPGEAEA
jgi:hypothetical protein